MKSKLIFTSALFGILGLFILTGCNVNGKDNPQKANTATETQKAPDENRAVKVDTVIIENMQFNPQELVINKGDKVVWINKGIVVHDVTEDADNNKTSGNIEIGESYEMTPDKEFQYFCSIHPTMKGSIKFKK